MLKNYVSSFVSKYLGSYIKDLDTKNLELSLIVGNVTLRDLKLKKSALKILELPIFVRDGFIRELVFNIPWRALNSKPVIIKIKGVYLIAGPMDYTQCPRDEGIKRNIRIKKRKLQLSELIELKKIKLDNANDDGFFDRLGTKIINNVQIFIEDVHFRYEDNISNSNYPFCLGITLEHLHVQSADSCWNPTFLNVGENTTYKIVNLKNLAIYMDTVKNCNASFKYHSHEELTRILELHTFYKNPACRHYHFLTPISGILKATLKRGEFDINHPLLKVDAELEKISFSLTSSQYRRFVDIIKYFSKYKKITESFEYYPDFNTPYSANPRTWWRYAILLNKDAIHKRLNSLNRQYITQYIKNRDRYSRFYEAKIGNRLTEEERKQMDEMETNLDYSDIIIFRQIAFARIQSAQKKKEGTPKSHRVFNYLFAWFSENNSEKDENENNDELIKEIYQTFADDKGDLNNAVFPPEYVKNQFDLRFLSCSFALRRDEFADEANTTGLDVNTLPIALKLEQNHFSISAKLRDESLTIESSLESISALDYYTLENQVIHVIRPNLIREETMEVLPPETSEGQSFDEKEQLKKDGFLLFKLEVSPLDSNDPLNAFIFLNVHPIDMIFSRKMFDYIVFFFRNFEEKDKLEIISQTVISHWETYSKSAQDTIKNSIYKNRIKLDINLKSPRIFVPLNFTDAHCPAIVANLGNIRLCSLEKQSAVRLEDMYERFELSFFGVNLMLLGGKNSEWQNNAEFSQADSIVDKFDLGVTLEIYNDEDNPNLPFINIKSSLNYLGMHLIDWKVVWMLDILQSISTSNSVESSNPANIDHTVGLFNKHEILKNLEYFSIFKENDKNPETSIKFFLQFVLKRLDIQLLKAERADRSHKTLLNSRFSDIEISQIIALFNLELNLFEISLSVSNQSAHVEILVNTFNIEDIIEKGSYLLNTKDAKCESNNFVEFKFTKNLENRSALDKVENKISLKMGEGTVQINRVSISCILQMFSDYYKYMKHRDDQGRNEGFGEKKMQMDYLRSSLSNESNQKVSIGNMRASNAKFGEVTTEILANIEIGTFSIFLNRSKKNVLALVLYPSTVAIYAYSDGCMYVKGNLGTIEVKFLRRNSVWKNVVFVNQSRDILALEFRMFDPRSRSYPGYDMIFKCNLNSLRFVFLKAMVYEVSNYFSAFEKIRSQVKFSTGYYAFGAIENVSKSSVKALLDIVIDNPTFILPDDLGSTGALVLDLGNITLKNSFENVGKFGGLNANVYAEVMQINVTGLNFRIVEGEMEKLTGYLIRKCDSNLKFLRVIDNLENRRDVPNFYLHLFVSEVDMVISQMQVCTMAKILQNNFAEEVVEDNRDLDAIRLHLNTVLEVMEEADRRSDGDLSRRKEIQDAKKCIVFKAAANMDKLSLALLGDGDGDGNDEGQRPFLSFSINQLNASIATNSSNEFLIILHLHRIYLKSTEESVDSKFFGIWESQELTGNEETEKSMLYFKYYTSLDTGCSNLEVELFRPRLYLISFVVFSVYRYYVEISRTLSDLLGTGNAFQMGHTTPKEEVILKSPRNVEDTNRRDVSHSSIKGIVYMNLDSPEIYVIGDYKSEMPASVVMHLNGIKLKVIYFACGRCKISLVFSRLNVHRCFLDTKNNLCRVNSRCILKQNDFELNSQFLGSEFKSIAVSANLFEFSLAYSDIKIIQIIFNVYRPLLERIRSSEEAIRMSGHRMASHLEGPRTSDPEESNNSKNAEECCPMHESHLIHDEIPPCTLFDPQKCRSSALFIDIDRTAIGFQVEFVISDSIRLTFINDILNVSDPLPVLKVDIYDIGVDGTFYRSGGAEFLVNVNALEVYSYNNSLMAYEPVVETWGFSVQMCNFRLDIGMHLRTKELLDINITKSLVETVVNLVQFFEYFKRDLDMSSFSEPSFSNAGSSQYYILNKTGFPILFWINDGSREKTLLNHGVQEALNFGVARRFVGLRSNVTTIGVEFPSGLPFDPIPSLQVSKIANFHHRISRDYVLVSSTTFNKNIKLVTVRGDYVFRNNTAHCLTFQILDKANIPIDIMQIEPSSEDYLPISFTNYPSIRVKPLGDGFTVCTLDLLKRSKGYSYDIIKCFHCIEEFFWTCVVCTRAHELADGVYEWIVEFSPVITFENTLVSELSVVFLDGPTKFVLHPAVRIPIVESKSIYQFNLNPAKFPSDQLSVMGFRLAIPTCKYGNLVALKNFLVFSRCSNRREGPRPIKRLVLPYGRLNSLNLYAEISYMENGSCHITVFSRYWLINCSGLPLKFANSKLEVVTNVPEDPETAWPDGLNGDPRNWYTHPIDHTVNYGYAHNRCYYDQSSVYVSVCNSQWSKSFALGIQTQGFLKVQGGQGSSFSNAQGVEFTLGVSIVPGSGKFYRTKIVRFYPAYMLFNMSQLGLSYFQPGDPTQRFRLGPGDQIPFHSRSMEPNRKLVISTENDGESVPFSPEILGGFRLKLRKRSSATVAPFYVNVLIKVVNCTTYIVFGDDTTNDKFEVISYIIKNRSSFRIVYGQYGGTGFDTVGPNETIPFYWDFVQIRKSRLQVSVDRKDAPPFLLSLDKIAKYPIIPAYKLPSGEQLKFEIKAKRANKVLIIEDLELDQDEWVYVGNDTHTTDAFPQAVSLHLKAELPEIGISIMDSTPQELIYLTMQDLHTEFIQSSVNRTFELVVESIQIDNQLYFSPQPIILLCVPPSKKPSFQLSVIQNLAAGMSNYFSYFGMQIQTLEVCITKNLFLRVLRLVTLFRHYLYEIRDVQKEKRLLVAESPEFPRLDPKLLHTTDMVYLEFFHLNSVSINISFISDVDMNLSSDVVEMEKVGGLFGLMVDSVSLLTNIDRTPLKFNALLLKNPHCSWNELFDLIAHHYTHSALKQSYKVLGYMKLLGSPLKFVSNIGTGVKDFFYEPAMGIVESPIQFTRGLAKGTKSLASKATYAIIDSAGKIIDNVASVGSELTFDEKFRSERIYRQHIQARDTGEGLMYGLRDLGSGVFDGVKGVVMDPLDGARENGTVGFIKGLSRGITGAITKPTIGVIDFVTRTLEGVKNTVISVDDHNKHSVRPPRYIKEDKLIRIYNYEKSLGQKILKTLEERRGCNDIYISHIPIGTSWVIFTKTDVILLQDKVLNIGSQKWTIRWIIPLKSIRKVTLSQKHANRQQLTLNLQISGGENPTTKKLDIPLDALENTRKIFKKLNVKLEETVPRLIEHPSSSVPNTPNKQLKKKLIQRKNKKIQPHQPISSNKNKNCRFCCTIL